VHNILYIKNNRVLYAYTISSPPPVLGVSPGAGLSKKGPAMKKIIIICFSILFFSGCAQTHILYTDPAGATLNISKTRLFSDEQISDLSATKSATTTKISFGKISNTANADAVAQIISAAELLRGAAE